jgi:hypothetical protein
MDSKVTADERMGDPIPAASCLSDGGLAIQQPKTANHRRSPAPDQKAGKGEH